MHLRQTCTMVQPSPSRHGLPLFQLKQMGLPWKVVFPLPVPFPAPFLGGRVQSPAFGGNRGYPPEPSPTPPFCKARAPAPVFLAAAFALCLCFLVRPPPGSLLPMPANFLLAFCSPSLRAASLIFLSWVFETVSWDAWPPVLEDDALTSIRPGADIARHLSVPMSMDTASRK